ncbi:MAG: cytochrome c oxidase accessory protein CcoG [Myxococcales bacterium]
MSQHLPIVYEKASSLTSDGRRNFVHPADVKGRFDRRRKITFATLIALWAALPWIEVGGHPAIFLDVAKREFYLFGNTFNAQDFWLVFFLLSGTGFALIFVTALWGRIWCGYACPHTVFLEGVFRPIERLIEGPRQVRMRRNAGPFTFDKLWRKVLKHGVYLLMALLVAHVIISYFVSLPGLYEMVLSSPSEHPTAFAWAASLTAALYFNFSWFREQLCLIICPYGRLQSVLTDRDTLVIGYDEHRGEPRGKASDPEAGDCIDCKRCVVVCPTGIDIRNGLQIDCVGCARCVDACDEIMDKLGRERGLVRYDSLEGLEGKPSRVLRPRIYYYGVLGVMGLVAATLAFSSRHDFEANMMRLRGAPPFTVDGDSVRNAFEIHVVNKQSRTVTYRIEDASDGPEQYTIAMPRLTLRSLQSQRVPVFVSFPRGAVEDGSPATLRVVAEGDDGETLQVTSPLIAPN